MAETLATLAFISALSMILSTLLEKGKWLASLTAVFTILAFVQTPFESIHQSGGSALVIVSVLCISTQYYVNKNLPRKFLNGYSGIITLVLLLTMYPEDGINQTIHEYSFSSSIQAFMQSVFIGILLAQLIFISISFENQRALYAIAILAGLLIWADLLLSGELFVVIISMTFIGLMPFLENKINSKLGAGEGRANALAFSTIVGIALIYAITYATVSQVNRIGDGDGAVAVALWLTASVTGLGLIGMLLPLLGFDSHPRPEAWGWRSGIAFSPIILCIQTDLSGHVLVGILLALTISISSPLVLEKSKPKPI